MIGGENVSPKTRAQNKTVDKCIGSTKPKITGSTTAIANVAFQAYGVEMRRLRAVTAMTAVFEISKKAVQ